jgi:hypothetical protein
VERPQKILFSAVGQGGKLAYRFRLPVRNQAQQSAVLRRPKLRTGFERLELNQRGSLVRRIGRFDPDFGFARIYFALAGCLGGWYARSDLARDIGDEPKDSRSVADPSMGEAQSGRPSPSVPDGCHQRTPEQRHRCQQGEIDQSHVLMKSHEMYMPNIRNPYGRLAENLHGVHVNDEHTQKEYCRPSDNVAERSFRPPILP